jgi:hypothetical protein
VRSRRSPRRFRGRLTALGRRRVAINAQALVAGTPETCPVSPDE